MLSTIGGRTCVVETIAEVDGRRHTCIVDGDVIAAIVPFRCFSELLLEDFQSY